MGIVVEFNPDLALRDIGEFKAGRRQEAECVPSVLEAGKKYLFLKRGQRNYWLQGELPLVETKGNQELSKPLASIVIEEVVHKMIDGEVWTRGVYRVVKVLDQDEMYFNGFGLVDDK
jgi:hypothetical protein